jgi:hypothetical protein
MKGWLDKYNDGGPIQPNYNDYSVSASPDFVGDGYSNVGRNYSPAWGGQFQDGGKLSFIDNPKLRNMLEGYQPGFLETVGDYRLPEGQIIPLRDPSTEVSISVGGGDGEPAYLIPSFKYGQPLQDPVQEFNMTEQYLGGPFKTVNDAETFRELRHQYVGKGQPLPSPIATANMAMGGTIGGATQGIPGATGFMYARTGTTPSEGKGRNKIYKTDASAQDGLKLIGGEEAKAVKSEDRIKAEEKVINRAPLDIIEEGRSKFRFNMLQDAVKHDMAIEQGVGLDDINNKDLKKKTMELLLKRESKLSNPTVEFVQGNGTASQPVLGYYDPNNKNALISLSDNLDKFNVDEFGNTVRHEFRHAYDAGGDYLTNYEKELISRKTNADNVEKQKALGNERYSYLQDPTEVTARLQEIRGALRETPRTLDYLKKKDNDPSWYKEDYKLDKEGYYLDPKSRQRIPIQRVYDARKDKATYEDLYYLQKNKGTSGLNDLLQIMKPEDIVDLLNTIAANKSQQGMPMAQNGMEMSYYQNGLDFQPKSISKNGKKIIKDDMGQWAHPGEITEIDSNQITMQGIPYPVLGISDIGDIQMMYPDEEYEFIGDSVTEYPMMKQGGQLTKLDQLSNFTNYNTKQPGSWLDKYQ